jgi:hypothetical protein
MSVAKKTNPSLWEKAKSQAKARMGGKHSARAMQLAVKIYKEKGGGYSGAKSSSNKLKKWGDQKWRTSDGSKSEGKKRYLPDKAWKSLSPGEKSATNRAKAKGKAAGKQFVAQPKSVAKKVAKFRK